MRIGARPALTAGNARVVLAPDAGGRIASLQVAGLELLVTDGAGPLDWGLYPMVPFAGRIREGRFAFEDQTYALPPTLGPHAIHGTEFDRAWSLDRRSDHAAAMDVALDAPWPFAGRVRHDVVLAPDHLALTLTVDADETMPVTLGWHPWFLRTLAAGGEAELVVPADRIYERDADHIPTGRLAPVPPGPWDDCFTGLHGPPVITWPGALRLVVEHACPCVVVFTEPAHALCVEPQSGPPDAVNLGRAAIVGRGRSVSAAMTLRWAPI